MSLVLLDTDVVSYLFKRDSRGKLYEAHLLNHELAIAIMTVAELFQWASMYRWGLARRQRLETWLELFTILPVDIEGCRAWAIVRARRDALGRAISPQDAWIAATALRYGIPLITHNVGDFQQIPRLKIISEQ